ncbi:MAG TPA: PD-(D/E)XK nuclease family protein, partial [Thermoanaerobaculia bacterium]|nr:PD-(D/E)XK nuclease family protein [Thermoanaerobaculia bacterium]
PGTPMAGFHRRLGGADAEAPPAECVRLVSAASAADERTEIAREILLAAADGIPLHAIGVIVRETDTWSAALSRELERLGIPNFRRAAESPADSALGRAIRLWWRLEEGAFSRTDVLGVLDLLENAGGPEVSDAARDSTRRAGITGGAESWSARLETLAAASATPARQNAIRAFARDAERVVGSALGWPRAALPWKRWADEISARLFRLFAPEPVPAALVSAAEALRALERLGGDVERESAARVFFGALDEQREAAGRLGVDGVFIGTAMAARGLSFAMTVVAQLVEREFPAPGRPDPLLFDGERAVLAAHCGRAIPLKVALRSLEERQLFGLAAESATRRLVMTTARRDEAMTRDRLPSPFFTDARVAAGGDDHVRTTELGIPTAFGPAVSETEALERALARSGPATVATADPRLDRDLERRSLVRAPRFTPFDGRLGAAARAGLQGFRPGALVSLSASRVGVFAACAYRYFLRNVQGLRPWEEPERSSELDPLGLGITFHDAARRIAESASSWPPTADEAGRIAAPAAEAALAEYEAREGAIAPGLIRELARDRVAALLRAWLDHERRRGDGLRPRAAEASVGSDAAPLAVDAGPFSVRFVGAIDRIDEDAAHRPARVVDYKVKLAGGFARAFGDAGRIVGGEAVQLPVYALSTGAPVASEYLVLEAGGAEPAVEAVSFTPERTADAIESLRAFLRGMDAAIAAGAFLPRTATRFRKDPCRLCDFADVCGPGHVERFLAKEADPDADVRALRALLELP